MSFTRASIPAFSHLDCSAYVLPQVTVEPQMRQCIWYVTIVLTVSRLWCSPHFSIWFRRPSRKDGAFIQTSQRYCSLRIWNINCRRAWWSCSSTADPWIGERRSLWTLLIWLRRVPNPCPSSRWCHPAISSSVVPFSSCLQSFPISGSSLMSALWFRWPKYWSFSFSIRS